MHSCEYAKKLKSTDQGKRDYSILLFLYNTGTRADEAAQLKIKDLDIA